MTPELRVLKLSTDATGKCGLHVLSARRGKSEFKSRPASPSSRRCYGCDSRSNTAVELPAVSRMFVRRPYQASVHTLYLRSGVSETPDSTKRGGYAVRMLLQTGSNVAARVCRQRSTTSTLRNFPPTQSLERLTVRAMAAFHEAALLIQ